MNRIERLELNSLFVSTAWGPAHVARAVLSGLGATAGLDATTLDEVRLEGAAIEIAFAAPAARSAPWQFAPAAEIDGALRANITDAAWVLDADVTIPIEGGRIDFNRATVEHLGPDSTMGVSPAGLHVDAPNGRTPLWLWQTAPVPGARFERRGAMLSQITDRGSLELQPLVEALLAGLPLGAPAAGARTLLARTRLDGRLRLGDGVVGNDRQRLVLKGRGAGSNRVELSSTPSGQGFALHVADLSAADLRFEFAGRVATAATVSATLALHLTDPGGKPAIEARFTTLTLRGVTVAGAPKATTPVTG